MDTHFYRFKERKLERENLRMTLNEEIILLTAILIIFGIVSFYLITTFGFHGVIFGLGVLTFVVIIIPAILIITAILCNTIYDKLFYSRNRW